MSNGGTPTTSEGSREDETTWNNVGCKPLACGRYSVSAVSVSLEAVSPLALVQDASELPRVPGSRWEGSSPDLGVWGTLTCEAQTHLLTVGPLRE